MTDSQPAAASPSSVSSRPLRLAARVVRALLWTVLALGMVLVLAWGVLHWVIVPRIDEFRPRVEQMASRALGLPVRIAAIEARSNALVPSFEVRQLELLGPGGQVALSLPRVTAALSLRSLWRMGFEQVVIEQPELEVRRTGEGRWLVAGIDVAAGGSGDDGALADWVFAQPELALRGGRVRWVDEKRAAPPLALSEVDVVLRNSAVRGHRMQLQATPPPGWGQRFTWVGQFRRPLWSRHPGDWRQWSGTAYADFPHVDVSQLRSYAEMGIDVQQGRGALRAWVDVARGAAQGVTADVALDQVQATLGAQLAPLDLRALSGRLLWKSVPNGFDFETQRLQFQTRDGTRWPGGNLAIGYTAPAGGQPAAGRLKADRLDLAVLRQMAASLPLDAAAHRVLRQHPAAGLVERLQARWQSQGETLLTYSASGRVSALAVRAAPAAEPTQTGVPGVRGADIDFELTQAGGRATLQMRKGVLSFPGVFEDPDIALDSLDTQLSWRIGSDGQIEVSTPSLTLANADVAAQLQARWQTRPGQQGAARFPGLLDLSGRMARVDGTRVHRYLPLELPETRRYLQHAIVAGQAHDVEVRIQGELEHIPFKAPRAGTFRFAGQASGVTLAYVPAFLQSADERPWPALTQVRGELRIDNNSLSVRNAQADVQGHPGWRFSRVQVRIPELDHTVVQAQAEGEGTLAAALGIVNRSPIDGFVQGALQKAEVAGPARLNLNLSLPIADLKRASVRGAVHLAGNSVRVQPGTPLLTQAQGQVTFSEEGFALKDTHAQGYGGPVQLSGGSRPGGAPASDPAVRLHARGQASVAALRQAAELSVIHDVLRHVSGAAAYQAEVTVAASGATAFSVGSELRGVASAWPAPLAKAADTAWPLRVAYSPAEGTSAERWQIALADDAALTLEQPARAGARLRGRLALGRRAVAQPAPLPAQGLLAQIDLDRLDSDAWQRAWDAPPLVLALPAASVASVATAASAAPTAAIAAAAGPVAGADPIAAFAQRAPTLSDEALPTALLLNVGELRFGQRPLHAVRASATREGALWQARVDAQELAGALRYHSDGAGRLHARLTRLYLPAESRQQEAPPLLEQPAQSLPGVDLSADDFRLAGKALGRLDIVADNQGPDSTDASASVWRLQRLELALPEGALHAQGEWRLPPARPGARGRTSLAVRLDVRDAGALLARLDMPGVLRGGRGQLAGHLGWRGSPIAPNAATMHGALNVGVEQGQFLKADAGAAKLLGVLSLQALPRRLTLNFKDVFSEGFAFDYIRGDVQMDRGLARTNNLQMKGVNAAVLMSGQASVVDETQDLRVVVVPEIDAGTAALVATAINPAIGIGAFIAQWLLRRPLSSAATQEFHISGQWSDPKVSRIDSKTRAAGGSAAPPTSAPPAAPAASAAAAAPADEADDRDADDRDLAPASAPARAPARAASAPASAPAGH